MCCAWAGALDAVAGAALRTYCVPGADVAHSLLRWHAATSARLLLLLVLPCAGLLPQASDCSYHVQLVPLVLSLGLRFHPRPACLSFLAERCSYQVHGVPSCRPQPSRVALGSRPPCPLVPSPAASAAPRSPGRQACPDVALTSGARGGRSQHAQQHTEPPGGRAKTEQGHRAQRGNTRFAMTQG